LNRWGTIVFVTLNPTYLIRAKNIIDGKRAITADMALRFSLFFDMSAGFWLNLQKDYELRLAQRENLVEFQSIVQPYSTLSL
jgi:plasmid maintenance system antidote protein VapI